MPDSSATIEKANAVLADRRQNARVAAQRHWEEISLQLPEIAALRAELNSTSIRLSRLILNRPENFAQALAELREENLSAQERVRVLLVEHGYPQDYLEIKYSCPNCQDSGYVGKKRCVCLNKLIQQIRIQQMQEERLLPMATFQSFKLDYYPDTPGEDGIVPREQMEKVFHFCARYAQGFSDKSPSLLMLGGTGLGKTHLSQAIARAVMEKGYHVLYGAAQDFFRAAEKEHFGREKADKDTLGGLTECDLLILDDLGAEFESNYYTSCLYHIVNSRLNAGKQTVISSNPTVKQLEARYSDRIISRLFSMYQILRFTGRDIRQLKSFER